MKKPTTDTSAMETKFYELMDKAAETFNDIRIEDEKHTRYHLARALMEWAKGQDAEETIAMNVKNASFQLTPDFLAGMLYVAEHCVGNVDRFDI